MRNINKLFITALMSLMVLASDTVFIRDGAKATISPVAEMPKNRSTRKLVEPETAGGMYAGGSEMRTANDSGGSLKGRSWHEKLIGIKSPDQGREKSLEQMKYMTGKGQAKRKADDNSVTQQAAVLPVLSAKAAFSAAIATTVGGESASFAEVNILSDWDGREDLAADHQARIDDFSQRIPPGEDLTLTRVAISAHTVANGFSENVFYYGDSVGNFWIGTDLNPDVDDASSGAVDSVNQVNIPALVNTGASGGFILLNRPAADCTDDQVTVTGIAVSPVCDLADFGLCGVIGEVVYVSILDIEGCAVSSSNQPFRTRIFAFAFADAQNGLVPIGALMLLRNPLSNMAGLAVDDNGSLYFQLADQLQFTAGTIFKVTETPRVVANCGTSPRINRVIANIPSGVSGGLRLGSALGSPGSPALISGGYQLTNYSGPSTTFGNIVALACGLSNTVYAAVARSAAAGAPEGTGPFSSPVELGATPSMIISFADCAGEFDSCASPPGLSGSLPIADGIADAAKAGLPLMPGVNNFRIFALGNGPDMRPVAGPPLPIVTGSTLKMDMQIDYTIYSGIAVDEESTIYVVSGGTPAGLGSNPSPLLGEILSFPDACPADRRADFIDLRGNAPPTAFNVGDGDSDRFDHIFWQAPDGPSGMPIGIAGLARGFLRYLNRATPNAIPNLPSRGIQGDDDTNGPIIFDDFDPSHQVAGGDRQNAPFNGDDRDGIGSPALPGPLSGGFEFLFGRTRSNSEAVWNGFFLNSNGNITFGIGDTDPTATVPDLRAGLPKIAPAWTDLNPNSRVGGFLNTFPVQALGFANINSFKIRWINVPEFGGEACGSSNTFSLYLYDDGTGNDENSSVRFQEGPTDNRYKPGESGAPPRPDESGQFCFEYSRMDLLGEADNPMIVGYSAGGLDPIRPTMPEINLGEAARDIEKERLTDCLVGTGKELITFEFFNEGRKASIGAGGEITFAAPDFDLRFEGNDPFLCTPDKQTDLNRGRVCLFVGAPPPEHCLIALPPVVEITAPQNDARIIDLNSFILQGRILTDETLKSVHLLIQSEKGEQAEYDITRVAKMTPPEQPFGPTIIGDKLFSGMNTITVIAEDLCNRTGRATIQVTFIAPFSRTASACVPGQLTRQIINFEEFPAGTAVTYEYLGKYGVVFPLFNPITPAKIIDRGGNQVLAPVVTGGGHAAPSAIKLVIQFSEPQKSVSLIAGLLAAGSTSATLNAFNRQNGGQLVSSDGPKTVTSSGTAFSVTASAAGDIYRVELEPDDSMYIDNLEFERQCNPQAIAHETVDLSVAGMEITQATNQVQVPQSLPVDDPLFNKVAYAGVPLIKDRYTIVRVYGAITGASLPVARISAHLTVYKGSGSDSSEFLDELEPLESFNGPAGQVITISPGFSIQANRPDIRRSWNFLLPLEWTEQGPIRLVADINRPATIFECDDTVCIKNNEFTVFNINFVQTAGISVVPVSVTLNRRFRNKLTTPPFATECTFWELAPVADPMNPGGAKDRCPLNPQIIISSPRFFQRVYPIREGGVNIARSPGSLVRDDGPKSDDDIDFSNSLLDGICEKFVGETIWGGIIGAHGRTRGEYYYGLVPFDETALDKTKRVPRVRGLTTQGDICALGPVGEQNTAAHEGGHTMNLRHAGTAHGEMCEPWYSPVSLCEDDWPYPHGGIGEFGFDVTAWRVVNPGNPPAGPHAHDFMSYGDELEWTSPRNYCRIIGSLGGGGSDYCDNQKALSADNLIKAASNNPFLHMTDVKALPVFSAQTPQGYFLIRGRVHLLGTAEFLPFYRITPNLLPPIENKETFSLELQNKGGQSLVTQKFDLAVITAHTIPDVVNFSQLLPFREDVERVVLKHNNRVLATKTRSANLPTVRVLTPNGGEAWEATGSQAITWQAQDKDPGDSLSYLVQYSADEGNTWATLATDLTETSLEVDLAELPGGDHALVRVLATDGFNTTEDQSDAPFKVVKKAPQIAILGTPGSDTVLDNVPLSLIAVGTDLEDGPLPDEAFSWLIDDGGTQMAGRYLNAQKLSLGQHTISLIARDSDGMVTVSALPRPLTIIPGRITASACCQLTMICPNDVVRFVNPGQPSAVVNYPNPRANKQDASIACSPPSGSSFPVGTTLVTCTAHDAINNVAQCSFKVTIQSSLFILCLDDMNVLAPFGQSSAIVNYPTPSAGPPNATVVCSPPSGAIFSLGATTVTCTATDMIGNLVSCSFIINVIEQANVPMCLQDDSSQSVLKINLTTGDYEYSDCDGFTLLGTGTVRKQGEIITLQHYAADRRVLASIDMSMRKGKAAIQLLFPSRTFMIIDKNILDNTCVCP